MKRLLTLFFVGALAFGGAACGGGDDSSSTDADTTETTGEDTTEFEAGSEEALAAAEQIIAENMPAEVTDTYGEVAAVSCPQEIAEEEGEYDCDVEFDDGGMAVATVSTTGGEIKLLNIEPAE